MGAMKKKDNREWTRMDANLENGRMLFIGNLGIGEEVTANGGNEEEGQPRMDANHSRPKLE
jgi:hypothetical protein